MKYVGFLVNGRLAMTFNNREDAYNAFNAGLGLVAEVKENGKMEVLYAVPYVPLHRSGCYVFTSQKIEERLEITHPDDLIIKVIKRHIGA